MRLISVVMGAKSMQARADQSRTLFNWGFSAFEQAPLAKAGASLANADVRYGKENTVAVGLTSDWGAAIPRGQLAQVHTVVEVTPGLTAPIDKGAVVGKVVATLDGKPLASQPVVALVAVERSGFFRRMWQYLLQLFK